MMGRKRANSTVLPQAVHKKHGFIQVLRLTDASRRVKTPGADNAPNPVVGVVAAARDQASEQRHHLNVHHAGAASVPVYEQQRVARQEGVTTSPVSQKMMQEQDEIDPGAEFWIRRKVLIRCRTIWMNWASSSRWRS